MSMTAQYKAPLEFELSSHNLPVGEITLTRTVWQLYCPDSERDIVNSSLYPLKKGFILRSREAYKKQDESASEYLERFINGADLLLHCLDSLFVLHGTLSLHFKYYKRKTERDAFKELEEILTTEISYFTPEQIAQRHVADNVYRQKSVKLFMEENTNIVEPESLRSLAMLIRYGQKDDDRLLKIAPDSEYVLHYLGYLLTKNVPFQQEVSSDEHLDFPDEIHSNPSRIMR